RGCRGSGEKGRPLQVEELRGFFRFGDGEVGNFPDDPVEIGLAYGVEIGVWSGIHEVDGVRNAVFDRELNGVEVVAERLAELERIPLDACEQLLVVFGRVLDVALVMGPA